MHTLRHWALVALVSVPLVLGACATSYSFEERLQDACAGYTATLDTLAAFRMEDRLSAGQVETIEETRIVLNEACFSKSSNPREALQAVQEGLNKLITIKQEAQ